MSIVTVFKTQVTPIALENVGRRSANRNIWSVVKKKKTKRGTMMG